MLIWVASLWASNSTWAVHVPLEEVLGAVPLKFGLQRLNFHIILEIKESFRVPVAPEMKWVDLPSGRCQEDFQGGRVLETSARREP